MKLTTEQLIDTEKAEFNNLKQCWSCKNCIGWKVLKPLKLPFAKYPECVVSEKYMCIVYETECRKYKPREREMHQ